MIERDAAHGATRNDAEASHAHVALLERQRIVLEMIVRAEPLADILRALCLIIEAETVAGVRASILLVDPILNCLRTIAAPSLPPAYNAAIDGIEISPHLGTCSAAAATARVVMTPDIASDAGWTGFAHLPLELGLVAAWSMPIVSAEGGVLGTLGTYFTERREPTHEERQLVSVLAHTAALAITRQNSDVALRASEARLRFLAQLAASLQPLTDAATVMATAARLLAQHVNVDRCAYAQIDGERDFVITGEYGPELPSILGRWPIAAFGPACVRDMRAGHALVVTDSEDDARIGSEDRDAFRATQIRAVICVPLHKDGVLSAAMAVHQRVPRTWREDEVELVQRVVASCWEALERARVTRELQESEARYRAMIESHPECVKLVAPDGTLLRINPAGQRLIGASEEAQAIGRSVYDLIAPEHLDAFRALNEHVCGGGTGALGFDVVSLQGQRRSMETNAVPLPWSGGGFVQLAVTHDVTQRVTIDRALSESRARLDYAVRLSGVGFWYCDLPFDQLEWDDRVKEHFFLTPDARVDLPLFFERIHVDDRETARVAIDASIQRRLPYDIVYRTVDPSSGAVKWIRALGGTAYADDGTPNRFDGVTVDVTRENLDQQRLARLLEDEREQGRLLAKVSRSARTIHASGSVDDVVRLAAEEARRLLGTPHVTIELRAGSEPATQGSGAPMTPSAISAPLLSHDGSLLGWLRVAKNDQVDITATDAAILAQLAQSTSVALESARLYDQLRDQDRRKDEFLATLAHELRNPLAPIRTGLHVLRLTDDATSAAKTRDMMERQLGHLVRMVDDLLDISRITRGKISLLRERVELHAIVDSALEVSRSVIDEHGHSLRLDLPPAPLVIDADPTRLAQVLANLLNNAAKYTPRGGHIGLAATLDDDALVLRVSDSGVGIPADMLGRVFEMFTQVDRSIERSTGGLGIGLTLVRRLVELHGGSVSAASAGADRGSVFSVRLPLPA